ncbi:MAG: carboxypeptidase regulatory-like domain-containing protein, partial [Planctomycetia bacterium]|nr:carboxypeptidase regulatory-like domain-containing protein [Planctomycetia bacterium]
AADGVRGAGEAAGLASGADGGVAGGARAAGRVVDAAGAPVAGVRVRLVPDDALLVYLGVPAAGRWSELETTTAADGTYGFEGIRPRAGYAVLFEAPGRALAVRSGVAFVAGERARLDDLALADGATVRGVVRSADGAPIAGARVGVALRPPNPLQFVLARADRLPWRQALVTTGADGRFEAAHVAEGRAVLVAEAPGHATKVVALAVPATGAMDVPDVVLPAADGVGGTALLADGTPAAGARVLVTRDGGLAGYDADVGPDGAFAIAAVPPGVGPVFAYLPGLAPVVTPPVRTGTLDVRVRFGASGRLAGRVVGPDGEPVPRFRVAVRSAEAETDLMGQFVENALAAALGPVEVVAADGRFDLGPLEARDVAVEVVADGYVKATVPKATVPPGAASAPVEVRLAREATVRGRVVDAEGRPVADASVCVQRGGVAWAAPRRATSGVAGLELPSLDAPVVEVRTDADGAFGLAPDAPGAVALTVRAPGFAVHFRAGLDAAATREPLVVTLARGANLAGRVTVTGPGPAGPMKVVAHASQGQLVADVAPDGTYRVEGVPPGTWLVVALPRGTILHPVTEGHRDELVAGLGARVVTVPDGLAAAVDLVVPPLPWVVATLTGLGETGGVDDLTFRRDDAPPGGAGEKDPAWSPLTYSAEPRPDGTFVVRGLLPGTYTGELWVTQVSGSTTHRAVVQTQAFVRSVGVPAEARAVPLAVPIAPR